MGQGSMPVLGGDQAAHGRDLAHLDRIPIKARENPLWFREVTPFDERLTAFQVALVGFAAPRCASEPGCGGPAAATPPADLAAHRSAAGAIRALG